MIYIRQRRCAYDYIIANAVRFLGTFVENELQFMAGLSLPGQVFVEVGAHVGTYALPLAKYLGSGGVIGTFETERVIHADQMIGLDFVKSKIWTTHRPKYLHKTD